MKRFAEVSPTLLSMISRACHVNRWEVSKVVMEEIDGHRLMCIGRNVVRNGLDGDCLTVMIRWRIDGKPSTKREVYTRFGVITEGATNTARSGRSQKP